MGQAVGGHEFRLRLGARDPERVFGHIVKRSGARITNLGSFESRALRGWVEANPM